MIIITPIVATASDNKQRAITIVEMPMNFAIAIANMSNVLKALVLILTK